MPSRRARRLAAVPWPDLTSASTISFADIVKARLVYLANYGSSIEPFPITHY